MIILEVSLLSVESDKAWFGGDESDPDLIYAEGFEIGIPPREWKALGMPNRMFFAMGDKPFTVDDSDETSSIHTKKMIGELGYGRDRLDGK